jgi:glutaredoxin
MWRREDIDSFILPNSLAKSIVLHTSETSSTKAILFPYKPKYNRENGPQGLRFQDLTCTQRVLTALYEKGVPYELITIDFSKAEHKSEKYMKLQPFGKVPVLDDDGFIMFESRAISKYIAKKYAGQGTSLMPAEDDLKAYGLFEQVRISSQESETKFADQGTSRRAH